ncbi:MAG: MEDS domain-containing protein, partial [Actinobacteria bacterium]|nr:MEDS domain-containing protein [Actinomycetota bacterium]
MQFYEDDEQLVETVGPYVADALRAGEAALVVATPDHRCAFEGRLTTSGIDVADARTRGVLVTLDAADTLARLTVDGHPDPAAFDAVIGGLIRELRSGGRPLRAYGEMVALLWDEGRVPAAIALETLWNDLGRDTAFSLFCAYKTQPTGEHAHDLDHVCDLHSAVVGGDATSQFGNEPQAARAARRFVTDTLRLWRYGDDLVGDAAMVVTELVTNSLVLARAAPTVGVSARHDTVRIAVRDAVAR